MLGVLALLAATDRRYRRHAVQARDQSRPGHARGLQAEAA
jgi:hypothetical protein